MKKIIPFTYILLLCLIPLVNLASSNTTKTVELSITEAIEAKDGYYLTFSGFYENSIALEWRNEWCDSYGKGCTMRSVNDLYYYPIREGFTFTLPEYPEVTATIQKIDSVSQKITLELKNTELKEIKQ